MDPAPTPLRWPQRLRERRSCHNPTGCDRGLGAVAAQGPHTGRRERTSEEIEGKSHSLVPNEAPRSLWLS